MKYAKLIDGDLQYAPRKIREGSFVIYNPPGEYLRQRGYKPVLLSELPTVEPGFAAVLSWEEDDASIVQTWTTEPADAGMDTEGL